jgi:hypothetical protein
MAVWWQASHDFIATADITPYYVWKYGNPSVGASVIGSCLSVGNGSGIYQPIHPTGATTIWFHARLLFGFNVNSDASHSVYFGNATRVHAGFGVDQLGRVWGSRGTYTFMSSPASDCTKLGTTTTNIRIIAGQWYSFDGEITISDTVGVIHLWVNGVEVLNLTGQDTYNNTGAEPANITTVGFWGSGGVVVDDFVVGDTTSPSSTHPGDTRVDCMMPNAYGTDRANEGAGQFSRSNTGVDEQTLIDDAAGSTGVSDYLYSDAVNEKFSVNVAALTNVGGTILGVTATVYATKADAGPCGFKIYLLSGGTRYYSEEFFPSFGSWAYYSKIWNQHPYPSDEAWTEADFNACEFGVERTT